MKNISFLIFICCALVTDLSSQSKWTEIGTEWYYSYISIGSPSDAYIKMQTTKDTVVNNLNAVVLEMNEVRDIETKLINKFILFQEDYKIFRLINDNFYLLYDFSANQGDILSVAYYHDIENDTVLNMQVRVDSVKTVEINGQTLRAQHISTVANTGGSYFFDGWNYETLGNLNTFIPQHGLQCDASCHYDLRCFESQSLSYNKYDLPCELIANNLNVENIYSLVTYPNPANRGQDIFIDLPSNLNHSEIKLLASNEVGQRFNLHYRTYKNSVIIDSSTLSRGIYFIQIIKDLDSYYTKLVIE